MCEAFEAEPDPDKRAQLVQRLLDDRIAYADHWLTFWNDLLRNDYVGVGYIGGGRKQITSWLYRALLDNKPYDQFVRELVNPDRESEGFANGVSLAGRGEREPAAGAAICAERRPGVSGRESEVCLLPRQLHRSIGS